MTMKLEERVAISNSLSLEDKAWFLTAWAKDIFIHAPQLPNHSGGLNVEVPAVTSGCFIQVNLRSDADDAV